MYVVINDHLKAFILPYLSLEFLYLSNVQSFICYRPNLTYVYILLDSSCLIIIFIRIKTKTYGC